MEPSRKIQTTEIAVFLLLIVPSLVLSLFVIRQGQLGFVLTATAIIFRDVGLVCLILFFLWRNGETVSRIGWAWTRLGRELVIGVVCFLPVFLGAALLDRVLLRVGLSPPATPLPSFSTTAGLPKRSWLSSSSQLLPRRRRPSSAATCCSASRAFCGARWFRCCSPQ